MSSFFSVDPGGKLLGWALWEGRELKSCGLSEAPKHIKEPRQRAGYHRGTLQLDALQARVVCEQMQIRGVLDKVRPQDLVELNLIAGHIGTEWCYPSEWKGGLPEEQERARTKARLSPDELARTSHLVMKKHVHVWSAIGIGLWALGRGWMPYRRTT